MSGDGWCTIESDPGVFTELIQSVGIKGVAVEELVMCDASMVSQLGEPLGLVLLFKITNQIARLPRNVMPDAQNVYFAKQVVGNACATQAIINTLMNQPDIDLGEEMSAFRDFTQHLPPDMRGEQIGQCDSLRAVHNSFSRASMFSFEDDSRRKNKEEDNFHFVTFIYKEGAVWELDGLRAGPVFIDSVESKEAWVELACSAIQARMDEIGALDAGAGGSGNHFSLMAIVKDRLPVLKAQREAALKDNADSPQAVALARDIAELEDQRRKSKEANQRKRHNYFPAFIALLRALRDEGKLQAAVDAAKAQHERRQAAAAARKAAAKK